MREKNVSDNSIRFGPKFSVLYCTTKGILYENVLCFHFVKLAGHDDEMRLESTRVFYGASSALCADPSDWILTPPRLHTCYPGTWPKGKLPLDSCAPPTYIFSSYWRRRHSHTSTTLLHFQDSLTYRKTTSSYLNIKLETVLRLRALCVESI